MFHESPEPIRTRWSEATGGEAGEDYARRMAAAQQQAAQAGEDAHGEARFVHELAPEGGRILDAGCGTGRVAVALHALGHPVMGVDADLSMLRVAAELEPRIPFWLADLADLDVPQAAIAAGFDVVVLAGNVVPYLAEGTLPAVLLELARVTKRDGAVVAGFGIHPADLPAGLPAPSLVEYDAAAEAAGLVLAGRYAGWGREEFGEQARYAVSVHRRTDQPRPPRVSVASTEPGVGTSVGGPTGAPTQDGGAAAGLVGGSTGDRGILPAGRIRSRRSADDPEGSQSGQSKGPERSQRSEQDGRGGLRKLFRRG
ncbi:MAG: class I SAM-dependent methyltransferase [Austwickia sp.]|nr:class I SAM-dependent methyltransferase [Austwickia sp.]MCO5308167.1 class I SAM-dependent methyltransferase [Austwickia sp.]